VLLRKKICLSQSTQIAFVKGVKLQEFASGAWKWHTV
jgi:hypothetical protein